MDLRQNSLAAIAGVLFGVGLGFAQMIDPQRVIGFLDITGNWDPTLAFVMGGAVLVTLVTFQVILRRPHPLFAERFFVPTRKDLDRPLIVGAILFGIGWGIGGYCPGPAIASLSLGTWNPVWFVLAMVIGSRTYQWWSNRQMSLSLSQSGVQPAETKSLSGSGPIGK